MKKAANQGYSDAQLRLGYCYFSGKIVEKNLDESKKWYTLASEQGSVETQFILRTKF